MFLGPASVWILGSSIIKKGFLHARGRQGDTNLGFDIRDVDIVWQGYSGLKLTQVTNKLKTLSQIFEDPSMIILHCGGNDIGQLKLHEARKIAKRILVFLKGNFPYTRIVWSQILPRNNWRYSSDLKAMKKARVRLNNYVATENIRQGGYYIKYPTITLRDLASDQVHLSDYGNDILLETLKGAILKFLTTEEFVFP